MNPYFTANLDDGIGPREDTNHEARAARLADELDAMRRERDAAREANAAAEEAGAMFARSALAQQAKVAQLETDLLELRGIVRSYLHGATELERTLALSVLNNTIRPERTGLRLVGAP